MTVTNTGRTLAFFVRLKLTDGTGGDEVLPVRWEDNYVTLLPGEHRELTATYSAADVTRGSVAVTASGWNVR